MIGIYKITNKINEKCYIGQSINIEKRWCQHVRDLEKGVHHCLKLQIDYKRYGIKNFKFEILEVLNNNADLDELEQYHILNNIDYTYNSVRVIKNIDIGNLNKIDMRKAIFVPKELILFNSINTQRIFFAILDKITAVKQKKIYITIPEFKSKFNVKGNSLYDRLEDCVEELSDKITNGRKLFEYCIYDNNTIEVEISDYMEYLLNTSSNYIKCTDIVYQDMFNIKFVKTLPIFILLNNNNGKVSIEINKLKKLLNIDGKYNTYSELKRNVLTKIEKDLINMGLNPHINEIRKSNSVHTINISI